MKQASTLVIVMAVAGAVAAPHVDQDDVVMEQNRVRLVTITYTLRGDPGIVTVDIQTNTMADASGDWVSIGTANQYGLEGAVNKFVDAVGTQSAMSWNPVEHWPDRKLRGGIVRAEVKAWATNNPPDVVVFDLANGGETSFYTDLDALPGGVSAEAYKTSKLVMKRCHAAGVPFLRGSPAKEKDHNSGDANYHFEDPWIGTLSSDFYLGVYELTEGQYQYIAGNVPAAGEASRKPHVTFSWNACRGKGTGDYNWPANGHAVDATSIMGRLRSIVKQDVDLPTAAQWEFACRAGTESAYASGVQDSSAANACGWNSGNSGGVLHEVGTIYSNEWGFSDMHGNASEWVLDYASNFPQRYDFETGPTTGPADHSWIGATHRMIRGGGFSQGASYMRSARMSDWAPPDRNSDHSSQIGCRVCLPTAVFRF